MAETPEDLSWHQAGDSGSDGPPPSPTAPGGPVPPEPPVAPTAAPPEPQPQPPSADPVTTYGPPVTTADPFAAPAGPAQPPIGYAPATTPPPGTGSRPKASNRGGLIAVTICVVLLVGMAALAVRAFIGVGADPVPTSDPWAGSGGTIPQIWSGDDPAMPYDIEVTSADYWSRDDRHYGLLVVQNHNGPGTWLRVTLDVDLIDADGSVLDTTFGMATIPPDSEEPDFVHFFPGDDGYASEPVSLATTVVRVAETEIGHGELTTSDIRAEADHSWLVVEGLATSTFDDDLSSARVLVMVRDESGELVDVALGHIDDLDAGTSAEFTAYGRAERELGDADTFEVFVSRW